MRASLVLLVLLSSAGCGVNTASLSEVGLEDQVAGESDGLLSLADARIIAVPDSDLTLAVWERRLGPDASGSAFALKRGGADFGLAKRTRFELVFRDEARDPQLNPGHEAASVYLVQFYGPALPAFVKDLEARGAEAIAPFPRNAYVMRLDDRALSTAKALPYVRAIEPFAAHRRVDVTPQQVQRPQRYQILPARQTSELKGALVAQLKAWGAEVHTETIDHFLLEATLDEKQLRQLAELPEVLHVDLYAPPESDMDKVRIISGANFIEETLGFTGQGVAIEVMDGNVDDTHPDLKNRGILFHGTHSGDASHGTCTTGIVFGDGTADPTGRGLLPNGQPIFADYDNFFGGADRKAHTAELKAPPYNAVAQSNSWGSSLTTEYTSISAEMDALIFELDFLIFNSQSNTGSKQSRPEAWAKNIVSIGGVQHQDTLDTADDRWDNGGSIGPASDGRLKPDLSHFWDDTWAPAQGGGYRQFGGTSGATPITAGYAGLMLQMWSHGLFGNPTPGATVFENRPHFTTAKALLINTATQWNFSGATHDLTRVHQGWGRVDATRLYQLRNSLFIINETDLLTQSQALTYSVTVAPGTPEFRATLTWADPPAVPSAGIHRVNDLTLKVTAPNGTVYFGNNGLAAGMFSTSGGTANTIDTVENVLVANPASGVWLVEVRGDEIVQDGHLETAAVDADFALVVSGVQHTAINTPPSVTFTSPVPNSSVSGLVTVTTVASDSDGTVSRVRFGLPDGTFQDDTNAPFAVSFNTASLANGPAQVTAVAFDDAGAASAMATLPLVIDNVAPNQAPVVTLAVPSSPLTGKVTFIATATDADGQVVKVAFTLPDGRMVEDTSAPFQVDFDTTAVANGAYSVRAVATDNLGLSSAVATAAVTIANEAAQCLNGRFAASGLPMGIPDANNTGIVVPIAVNGDGKIGSVKVSLRIAHSYRGDLLVELVSPSGAVAVLHNRAGGSADNLELIDQVVSGLSGPMAGTWSLRVSDRAAQDVGTLQSFSLNLVGDCGAPVVGWKAGATPALAIADNATTCHQVTVGSPGDAAQVKLSFSLQHSYRKAVRVRLVHGATNVTVIQAGTLPAGNGTVTRTALPVAGFSGDAAGVWELCIDETDAYRDTGTLQSWQVASE